MSGDGSTLTVARQDGRTEDPGDPGRGQYGSRVPRFVARLRRNRLGLAALLPAFAMAAVFVAEPFAGMQSVDQPTAPPTVASQPAYPGSGH